jgi:hypothetical protein
MNEFVRALPADVPWITSNVVANTFRIEALLDPALPLSGGGCGGALIYSKAGPTIDGPLLYQLLSRCEYFWTDYTRDEFSRSVLSPIFYPFRVDYDFIYDKFQLPAPKRVDCPFEKTSQIYIPYGDIFLG